MNAAIKLFNSKCLTKMPAPVPLLPAAQMFDNVKEM